MAQDDSLHPIGAGRNNIHWCMQQFFQPLNVIAGILRQLFQSLSADSGVVPAWQLLIDGLYFLPAFRIKRHRHWLAVSVLIANTNFHAIQTIQHIQLGQTDSAYAVNAIGMVYRYRIKPTTTTLTASSGAKLVPFFTQVLPHLAVEFSRERTRAHTRSVSLGNTEDIIQIQRAET